MSCLHMPARAFCNFLSVTNISGQRQCEDLPRIEIRKLVVIAGVYIFLFLSNDDAARVSYLHAHVFPVAVALLLASLAATAAALT